MSGLNKVMLIGRLGKNPETRTFENGGSICTFSMATSETYTDKTTGEKKEVTEWHNVVVQNELGKVAQKYLQKGHQVYIEGKNRTGSYEAKDNSGTRYVTEVIAQSMTLLEKKPDNSQGQNYEPAAPQQNANRAASKTPDYIESDDLPF